MENVRKEALESAIKYYHSKQDGDSVRKYGKVYENEFMSQQERDELDLIRRHKAGTLNKEYVNQFKAKYGDYSERERREAGFADLPTSLHVDSPAQESANITPATDGEDSESTSFNEFVMRDIVKPIAQGALTGADLVNWIGSKVLDTVVLKPFGLSTDAPIDAISNAAGKLIDKASFGASEGETALSNVVENVTGMLTGGGVAKTVAKKLAPQISQFIMSSADKTKDYVIRGAELLGSTNKSAVAGVAAGTAVAEQLKESGASAEGQLIGGFATDVATQGIVKGGIQGLKNIPKSMVGLSPNSIDKEAVKAAKDLNIVLPADVASNSAWTNKIMRLAENLPGIKGKVKSRMDDLSSNLQGKAAKIADDIGSNELHSPDWEDIAKRKEDLYSEAIEQSKQVNMPNWDNTKKALNNLKAHQEFSTVNKGDGKRLTKEFSQAIDAWDKVPGGAKVAHIISTKKDLETELFKANVSPENTLFRQVTKAMNDDLSALSEEAVNLIPALKEANSIHRSLMLRKEFDKMFSDAILGKKGEGFNYDAFARAVEGYAGQNKIFKKFTPEVRQKLNKIAKVAKSKIEARKNNPNPSGSGDNVAAWGTMGSIAYGSFVPAIITYAGVGASVKLLTSQKFLKSAYDYALNSSNANKVKLSDVLKSNTGIGLKEWEERLSNEEKDNK